MALNDKDKEYLEKTIEDKLDNVVEKITDHIDTTAKNQDANMQKIAKEEKKTRLEELRELKESGEATIAEKIELLKLEVKNVIPKGAANLAGKGVSNTTKGIGRVFTGAKQIMVNGDLVHGISSLLGGTIQTGKGIIQGTAGIVGTIGGTAINILSERQKQQRQKKNNKDDKQLEEVSKGQLTSSYSDDDLEEKSSSKNILSQILKVKNPTPKIVSPENTTKGILSKGLQGLTKSLRTITTLVRLIFSKEALIVGSVIGGIAAIAALIIWIKNGGLKKLLDDVIKPAIAMGVDKLVKKLRQGLFEEPENLSGNTLSSQSSRELNEQLNNDYEAMTPFSIAQDLQKNYSKPEFSQGITTTTGNKDVLTGFNDEMEKYLVDNTLSITGDLKYNKESKKFERGTNNFIKSNLHNENIITIHVPVKALIIKYTQYTTKEESFNIAILCNSQNKRIIYTKVVEALISEQVWVPPNTALFKVEANAEIWGDYQKFCNSKDTINAQEGLKDSKLITEAIDNYYELNRNGKNQEKLNKQISGHQKILDKNYEKNYNIDKYGTGTEGFINKKKDDTYKFLINGGINVEKSLNNSKQLNEPNNSEKVSSNEIQDDNKNQQIALNPISPSSPLVYADQQTVSYFTAACSNLACNMQAC